MNIHCSKKDTFFGYSSHSITLLKRNYRHISIRLQQTAGYYNFEPITQEFLATLQVQTLIVNTIHYKVKDHKQACTLTKNSQSKIITAVRARQQYTSNSSISLPRWQFLFRKLMVQGQVKRKWGKLGKLNRQCNLSLMSRAHKTSATVTVSNKTSLKLFSSSYDEVLYF